MKNAVILLSGGLDSATTLGIAASEGYACHALSFDYGQRHQREIAAAAALAKHYQVRRHVTMKIDLRAFGGSALTADIAVPKDALSPPPSGQRLVVSGQREEVIPITYVPARNTVFLAFAVAFAETVEAFDIFIGVNAVDYSGYPDCRPEFVQAFERVANLGTRAGVEAAARGGSGGAGAFHIHAPLVEWSKAQIIRTGLKLGVPYELTHSCYDPTAEGKSCGHCDSCLLRLAGFREAGARDPVAYA
ncbi:MAG TPA: 7-cyano-7-deazaguanine synthase QueC [Phycisphaerae bacterium]|nr:7-cyano-7-deazaguanine synthase QueC [Phycisphaerae bacterium]